MAVRSATFHPFRSDDTSDTEKTSSSAAKRAKTDVSSLGHSHSEHALAGMGSCVFNPLSREESKLIEELGFYIPDSPSETTVKTTRLVPPLLTTLASRDASDGATTVTIPSPKVVATPQLPISLFHNILFPQATLDYALLKDMQTLLHTDELAICKKTNGAGPIPDSIWTVLHKLCDRLRLQKEKIPDQLWIAKALLLYYCDEFQMIIPNLDVYADSLGITLEELRSALIPIVPSLYPTVSGCKRSAATVKSDEKRAEAPAAGGAGSSKKEDVTTLSLPALSSTQKTNRLDLFSAKSPIFLSYSTVVLCHFRAKTLLRGSREFIEKAPQSDKRRKLIETARAMRKLLIPFQMNLFDHFSSGETRWIHTEDHTKAKKLADSIQSLDREYSLTFENIHSVVNREFCKPPSQEMTLAECRSFLHQLIHSYFKFPKKIQNELHKISSLPLPTKVPAYFLDKTNRIRVAKFILLYSYCLFENDCAIDLSLASDEIHLPQAILHQVLLDIALFDPWDLIEKEDEAAAFEAKRN